MGKNKRGRSVSDPKRVKRRGVEKAKEKEPETTL
jgi:hypothetical protein